MEADLPDYRAYIVGTDGHFTSSETIVASDDKEAIKIAQKLVDGHDVEVWHMKRKIAFLPREKE
jgi:hypothetical protein